MKLTRVFLILLAALLVLPGLVFAEQAEQDGCTYTKTDEGVIVQTVPVADRENVILVPQKIGELEVKFLDAASVPEKATEVFLPEGVTLHDAEKLDHEIIVYSYQDYSVKTFFASAAGPPVKETYSKQASERRRLKRVC